MGKPFKKELEQLNNTIAEINAVNPEPLRKAFASMVHKPLYIIGSGGSFSACQFAALLHQQKGMMAQAITPLETFYKQGSFHGANVLFISAGGRNKDILFGFKTAVSQEPDHIVSICTSKNTPLSKLSQDYTLASVFEYPLSSGKDGFLASNSLVAFFGLLMRGYCSGDKISPYSISKKTLTDIDQFLLKVSVRDVTHSVLYGSFAQPVAVDIESKFTEAALGATLLADYRNFGHGRHHWFAKRPTNSSIVALITPETKELAEKTLQHVPSKIPILKLETKKEGVEGSLELLIQSFYLADKAGEQQGIDPGRPGVPSFGSKLYNLNYYQTLQKSKESIDAFSKLAIQRKIRPGSMDGLGKVNAKKWSEALKRFEKKLTAAYFGAIVFDYDRTLCADENRETGPSKEIIAELNRLLSKGYLIGIATGRGQSVRDDMQRLVTDKKLWDNIVIGYYNGADLGFLHDNKLPVTESKISEVLEVIHAELISSGMEDIVEIKPRPNQLTIESKTSHEWNRIKEKIYHQIMRIPHTGFMILESSRSVDVISRPGVSKLNIINYCQNILKKRKLPYHCLCIGDKGKWPGNDFELLSSEFSLSVNEVSADPDTCWNLSPLGVRDAECCLFYLKNILTKTKGMKYSM